MSSAAAIRPGAEPSSYEIHDKFVVCGLNGNDPMVYCGSSNLAGGGEARTATTARDHDADVATAFAIEALGRGMVGGGKPRHAGIVQLVI